MTWQSESREQLLAKIAEGLESADDSVRAAWERIRCEPEKWQCSPWGDAGRGFWVVAEFLATLPEARAAEDFAEQRADASTQAPISGPGRIGRRQTTYWDLHADAGGSARAHFSDKQEARFSGAAYDRVTLTETHPLLRDYDEPWQALFVTNAHLCGHRLIHEIDVAVSDVTHGWRRAAEYLGASGEVLRHGNGLLLQAPATVALRIAEIVRKHGAKASLLDDRPARSGYRALIMGTNFIVAHAFRFESPGA